VANEANSRSETGEGESGPEVLLDRREDGVALLTLNRPKANALSTGLLGLLADLLEAMSEDPPGAIVIWGGRRIFAAGADVKEFAGTDVGAKVSDAFTRVTAVLGALPSPSIAAINGFALGGGLELAMACDLRVAGTSAKVGQPEILLGIIPGGGGTQRLPRLVGVSRAKDLIMTGRQIRAEEAFAWGLFDRLVPDDEVIDTALALGAELAAGARLAIAATKRAVDGGLSVALDDGLGIEREEFISLFGTSDAQHGIESFASQGPG
jgi:enoyl-CoA hydratase/carnithine racemase